MPAIYRLTRHNSRGAFCCLEIDWLRIEYIHWTGCGPSAAYRSLPKTRGYVSRRATLFQPRGTTNGVARCPLTFNKCSGRPCPPRPWLIYRTGYIFVALIVFPPGALGMENFVLRKFSSHNFTVIIMWHRQHSYRSDAAVSQNERFGTHIDAEK